MSHPIVSAWNEWDPLEEVVVGRADFACFEPSEPAYRPTLRDPQLSAALKFPCGPKQQEIVDRANRELQGLCDLLEAHGVTVRRPQLHDFRRPIETPNFRIEHQLSSVCPRDVLLTIGHEIIEAPMARRARFFEYLPYRSIIRDYWARDQALQWTSAPKPSMANGMYHPEFWDWSEEERRERAQHAEFCLSQHEVVFDAADCVRLGNDIFVQESLTTNRMGVEWLRRHLAARGLRVHAIHFPSDLFAAHIDCTFVPLRPYLALVNPERPMAAAAERMFRDNGWEFLVAPAPISSSLSPLCQASPWLALNILSISPTEVICEEQERPLHALLEGHGLTVYTLPFRHVFEFGGGFHSATWDIRRSGACASYFPALDA